MWFNKRKSFQDKRSVTLLKLKKAAKTLESPNVESFVMYKRLFLQRVMKFSQRKKIIQDDLHSSQFL
jgi:hypothetical protein